MKHPSLLVVFLMSMNTMNAQFDSSYWPKFGDAYPSTSRSVNSTISNFLLLEGPGNNNAGNHQEKDTGSQDIRIPSDIKNFIARQYKYVWLDVESFKRKNSDGTFSYQPDVYFNEGLAIDKLGNRPLVLPYFNFVACNEKLPWYPGVKNNESWFLHSKSFSAPNQGVDVAIGDINNNGKPDIVTFIIDNPNGTNMGYYKIGWDLNSTTGKVSLWEPARPVDGWFSSENQGGGITIGDVNNNGKLDIVLFFVDNPIDTNSGHYKIGWDLSPTTGKVTSWGYATALDGWFSSENQGAGITIGNVDNNPLLDIVTFFIHNPAGTNMGYYKIGYNINPVNGMVSSWGPARPADGWFSSENQGAGISIGNVDNNPLPDIVTYFIDNPGGTNMGYFKIGYNINPESGIVSSWGHARPADGWFSSENQGAGIALSDINNNGIPDIYSLFIDQAQSNNAFYKIGWDLTGEAVNGWGYATNLEPEDSTARLKTEDEGWFIMNVANTSYQQYYSDYIKTTLVKWPFRGIGLDNMVYYPIVNKFGRYSITDNLYSEWHTHLYNFLANVRNNLGSNVTIIVNALGLGAPVYGNNHGLDLMAIADGGLMEDFHTTAYNEFQELGSILNIMNSMKNMNKIFLAATHYSRDGGDYNLSAERFGINGWDQYPNPPGAQNGLLQTFYTMQTSYLARYLLQANNQFGYSFQPGYWRYETIPYYKQWDEEIGNPRENMVAFTDYYRREFDNAIVYVNRNNTETNIVASVLSNYDKYQYDGTRPLGDCFIRKSTSRYQTLKKNQGIILYKTQIDDPSSPLSEQELQSATVPTEYKIYQNYPNPFNPSTRISYSVPSLSNVKIAIYDILGQEIKVLTNSIHSPGQYSIEYAAGNLSSGLYFCKIQSFNYSSTIKMFLNK